MSYLSNTPMQRACPRIILWTTQYKKNVRGSSCVSSKPRENGYLIKITVICVMIGQKRDWPLQNSWWIVNLWNYMKYFNIHFLFLWFHNVTSFQNNLVLYLSFQSEEWWKVRKIWINFSMIGRNKEKYNKIKKINYHLHELWKLLLHAVNKYTTSKVFVSTTFSSVFR